LAALAVCASTAISATRIRRFRTPPLAASAASGFHLGLARAAGDIALLVLASAIWPTKGGQREQSPSLASSAGSCFLASETSNSALSDAVGLAGFPTRCRAVGAGLSS
jgi:hypothetical protein